MRFISFLKFEKALIFIACGIICGLFIVVSGCGDSGQSTPPSEEPASADVSIQWHVPEQDPDASSGTEIKSVVSASCSDVGVDAVEIVVYDDLFDVLASSGPWPCAKGEGEALSIVPGEKRHFVVLGRDGAGEIIYHGITITDINPGLNSTVSIDAFSFVPGAVRKKELLDTQIDIVWAEAVDGADIWGYRIYSAGKPDPIGDSVLEAFSHADLFASTEFCYQVSAYDFFDNESRKSDSLCLKTTSRIVDTGQSDRPEVNGDDGEYLMNPVSYTKLDASGNDLQDDATEWAMVRDNVTGLIWEVKTQDGGIHNAGNVYAWDDVEAQFIDEINGSEFGGLNEWRLPTKFELSTLFIAETEGLAINTDFFKNSTLPPNQWWTATPSASTGSNNAWVVDFRLPNIVTADKTSPYFVRAVHGKPRSMFLEANEKTVIDKSTGLMWARFDQLEDPAFVNLQREFVKLSWTEALEACENLNFAGFDDWRMPNIKEYMSIVKADRVGSAYDRAFFSVLPGSNGRWWSSTTVTGPLDEADSGVRAWKVGTWSGYISAHLKDDDAEKTYVHPVRTVITASPQAE